MPPALIKIRRALGLRNKTIMELTAARVTFARFGSLRELAVGPSFSA
jgi:hypothetical protein